MTNSETISSEISTFAKQISMTWRKAAAAIVETGQKLLEARQRLSTSEFLDLKEYLRENEGISESTLSKLQAIARHPIISKQENLHALPPSYTVLYRLTQADEAAVAEALKNGDVSSSLQMADVEKLFFSSAKKAKAKPTLAQTSATKITTLITISGKLTDLNVTTQAMLHKALELVKLQTSIKIEEI